MGFDEDAVKTNFGKILKDRKETGAELFGVIHLEGHGRQRR